MELTGVTGLISCPCCGECHLDQRFVTAIELLAKSFGPLHSNSMFRCEKHNAELPGSAKHSCHLTGQAADIAMPKANQTTFIIAARACGFKGFGIGSDFVHIDVRDVPATWTYPNK